MAKTLGCIFFSLLVFTACTPHAINPEPGPAVTSIASYASAHSNDAAVLQRQWWKALKRQSLNQLIGEGLNNNQNLAQAYAQLKQAQAQMKQSGVARLPEITLEGEMQERWEGRDKERGAREIGATLSWELDFFKRLDSLAKSDSFEFNARIADAEAVALLLSAEIAEAYFGAVAANKRIALLKEQLRLDRDLLNLLTLRLKNGVGTTVEKLQQESRVANSESLIPLAEAELYQFENRLDVLLGHMPDGKNRVSRKESLRVKVKQPAVGVPVDLLLNRPDLRAAKARLVAADAEIAAAIADRLPRITLDGTYFYSEAFFFAYTGPVFGLTSSFVQPLLDWGRRKAEVERNKALYEERLAAFTQLYLEAVEEVENTLYLETKQRAFLKKLRRQRKLLKDTIKETESRYLQGVDNYLPVIVTLQELREVERTIVTEERNLVLLRIQLHRAVGGHVKKIKGKKDAS